MLDPIFNSAWMQNALTFPLFQLLFTVIITVLASVKVTLQGAACRRHIRNSQDSTLYNTVFFAAVSLFLALTLNLTHPSLELLIWSFGAAASTVVFQVVYSVALTEGPVSLTVLIINFAIVAPTIASAIVFKENVYYSQLLGILCLFISFPLSMKESTGGEKKANKKWLMLTIITLLANSLGMVILKLFKITDTYRNQPEGFDLASNTLLFYMYVFACILALAVYLCRRFFSKGAESKHTLKLGKSVLIFASLMGLDLAVYQKFYMTANMKINGAFFFPTFSGLQSISMTVIGIILFGDRLNKKQLLGVLFGILSIILLNMPLGGSFTIG